MLNRLSDIVRLRTFADSQVTPVSRVNLETLADLAPGDYVRGLVEAARPDGTFRVAIRNQTFLLRLPFQARPGDALQLSVVAREPQIKFALVPEPDIPDLPASLSETARFITALLDESEKMPLTSVVRGGAPLLTVLPADNREIAAVLRDALAHSGMFYEAHQAQWIAGERTIAALMREPQARLAPLRHRSLPALADHGDNADTLADIVPEDLPQLPHLPVHRDALAMIKQQLDTLESRTLAWHGMIWPGQPLDWEVSETPPEAPRSAGAPAWRTRLRLELPRLGKLEAILTVAGRGVTVAVHAADAGTQTALAVARATLQQSLRDAGITPLSVTVGRDESA